MEAAELFGIFDDYMPGDGIAIKFVPRGFPGVELVDELIGSGDITVSHDVLTLVDEVARKRRWSQGCDRWITFLPVKGNFSKVGFARALAPNVCNFRLVKRVRRGRLNRG